MPALVTTITDEHREPAGRERRLMERIQDAHRDVLEEVNEYEHTQELTRRFHDYHGAQWSLTAYWVSKAGRFERDLRAVLAADLSDDLRAQIMALLYGETEGRRRNLHLLQRLELQMLEDYRAMDAAGKLMVRTLFDRLRASSSTEQADEKGGS